MTRDPTTRDKSPTARAGMFGLGLAVFFVAAIDAASAQSLKRIPLDNHTTLGTTVTTDTSFRTEGGASIRVTTRWPTVINIAEMTRIAANGGTLIFQAKLRSRALDGNAYLELWSHFADGSRYVARGVDSAVTGSVGWTRVRTVFHLEPGQRPSAVTLNLVINGTGTVWIDEARLLTRPSIAAVAPYGFSRR